MSEQKTPEAGQPPDTLDEKIGRWISIAQHRGYGTMTEGDWAALEATLQYAPLHIRAATDEIHSLRAETLTECQASVLDGECVHPRCPVGWKAISTGADPSMQCPLPWHRNRDGDDE